MDLTRDTEMNELKATHTHTVAFMLTHTADWYSASYEIHSVAERRLVQHAVHKPIMRSFHGLVAAIKKLSTKSLLE